ncbi:unnamed protein product [Prunus armeniaca]|uniref:Uncharacterized protein n=1 Tax=Prunus armeniaca TaxID=36596 RepID=A0A6J5TZC8_PRUAR|nr:unnamed protein product [Prunus armeniaca]
MENQELLVNENACVECEGSVTFGNAIQKQEHYMQFHPDIQTSAKNEKRKKKADKDKACNLCTRMFTSAESLERVQISCFPFAVLGVDSSGHAWSPTNQPIQLLIETDSRIFISTTSKFPHQLGPLQVILIINFSSKLLLAFRLGAHRVKSTSMMLLVVEQITNRDFQSFLSQVVSPLQTTFRFGVAKRRGAASIFGQSVVWESSMLLEFWMILCIKGMGQILVNRLNWVLIPSVNGNLCFYWMCTASLLPGELLLSDLILELVSILPQD